jgi:hypothetical protein
VERRGVPTLVGFFGIGLAKRLGTRLAGPTSWSGGRGVRIMLAEDGTATFEFPHLARLLEGLRYDTDSSQRPRICAQ